MEETEIEIETFTQPNTTYYQYIIGLLYLNGLFYFNCNFVDE
ncbi:unnamed protein product [Arabidopsis halleri]